ncbi:MAG: hypothetical protein FJ224_10395 [Lentisphaerae bacterium]|nr:hypothetical protein [Lentisphaerota bacterium]
MIPAPRELYFVYREGGRFGVKSCEALIRGDWKLMQSDPFRPLELYHLKTDPAERNDLAADPAHRRLFAELLDALRRHVQQGGAIPWQKPAKQRAGSAGRQGA